jgi:hypothetical protein
LRGGVADIRQYKYNTVQWNMADLAVLTDRIHTTWKEWEQTHDRSPFVRIASSPPNQINHRPNLSLTLLFPLCSRQRRAHASRRQMGVDWNQHERRDPFCDLQCLFVYFCFLSLYSDIIIRAFLSLLEL